MPGIMLSDEVFAKLQALAVPFVDTPESVIDHLASAQLERRSMSSNGEGSSNVRLNELRLNPDVPENLTHTRLLAATIDGRAIHRPKWNGLLDYLHVLARQRLSTFEAVRKASGANLREGRFEENGYRYLPDADISIQGVDANLAWDHSLRMARVLQVPLEVRLEWRNKEAAAHPGQTAVLSWAPEPS